MELSNFLKQRKHKATGTEDTIVKETSLRKLREEHYNQAKSYIQRIQAQIPGKTIQKIAAFEQN